MTDTLAEAAAPVAQLPPPVVEQDASPEESTAEPNLYSADEVLQNFQALLESLDFTSELAELGLKGFFSTRLRTARREFTAMTICLWGLALERSFPERAEGIFGRFLERSSFCSGGKRQEKLRQRIQIYVDLFKLKKDADFGPIAQYMAETLALKNEDKRSLQLKLALIMRNIYKLVFDRLI